LIDDFRMRLLAQILNFVGGHIANSHRRRAYLYLLALVLVPFVAWILEAFWLAGDPGRAPASPIVGSIALTVGFLAVAFFSLRSLLVTPKEQSRSISTLGALESVAVSFVAWAVIAVSTISFYSRAYIGTEKLPVAHMRNVEVLGHLMPDGSGSVEFTGRVRTEDGKAVPRSLVFLFDGSYVSRPIDIGPNGEFHFRLPPGTWKLRGIYLPDLVDANISYGIEPPVRNRALAFHVLKGPIAQTYVLDVTAK